MSQKNKRLFASFSTEKEGSSFFEKKEANKLCLSRGPGDRGSRCAWRSRPSA
jgi:hypothetical protein